MINPISIIIQVDTELNLIVRGFVNQSRYDDESNIAFEKQDLLYSRTLDLSSGTVRLYTVFESVWAEIMETLTNSSMELEMSTNYRMVCLIGPHAGFTNSRIVYMWLKSHQMVYPQSTLHIVKTSHVIDLMSLNDESLQVLITGSSDQLMYAQEPRIGYKGSAETSESK